MSDTPDFRLPDPSFDHDRWSEGADGTPPFAMPELPWALAYEEGSLFSTGGIGEDMPWIFASEDRAVAAIAEAEQLAPEFGRLTAIQIDWEHLLHRYGRALAIDGESRWEFGLTDLSTLDDSPLPDEPYALFVWGGGIDRYSDAHEEGEWVVHRDERGDFVLFFEDLDSAESVLREFRAATGDEAEVRRTRAISLTDSQGVRFTHRDGRHEDLTRGEYMRRSR